MILSFLTLSFVSDSQDPRVAASERVPLHRRPAQCHPHLRQRADRGRGSGRRGHNDEGEQGGPRGNGEGDGKDQRPRPAEGHRQGKLRKGEVG